MKNVTIKCPSCKTTQEIPDIYIGKATKCCNCKEEIITLFDKSPPSELSNELSCESPHPLPGTKIAGIWDIIGILPCAIVSVIGIGIVILAIVERSTYTWGRAMFILWIVLPILLCLALLLGLIPFTISATIRAINAVTLELRELRNEIKKSNIKS